MGQKEQDAIKQALATDPVRVRELWLQVGQSLLLAQFSEHAIATFITLPLKMTKAMAQHEIDDLLEEERKKTLGGLIATLRKEMQLSQSTENLLTEHLRERNWLVHNLVREADNEPTGGSDATFTALIERVRDVGRRSTHLQAEFGKLLIKWMQTRGVTEDQIDAAALANVRAAKGLADASRTNPFRPLPC
jgi:hypothetical protein